MNVVVASMGSQGSGGMKAVQGITIDISGQRLGKQSGKTSRDRKTRPRVHLIGCRGLKLFLPKDGFKFCQNLNCQN